MRFFFQLNCFNKMSIWSQRSASFGASKIQMSQLEILVPLVDENNKVLGAATKHECHKLKHQNDIGMLHRAFSVFLFNSRKELLLQQRSCFKVTFPNYFTNTCCSHPSYDKDELEEKNDLGIKLAAQRRMNFELGVPKNALPVESFQVLTKVHYYAKADKDWGEHEIDYVLICKRDIDLENVNEDEVQKTFYVDQKGLKEFLKNAEQNNNLITPWFKYVTENFLYKWWDNLDHLEDFKDGTIHKAGDQSTLT